MDLIERHKAIDALKKQMSDWNDDYNVPVRKSIENIERLPSAQPETHDKRTETHACDLISRQAAINLISQHTFYDDYDDTDKCSLVDGLRDLPSAQPEMIREIRKWINSGNRGNADYFIVDKIEEIINKYE